MRFLQTPPAHDLTYSDVFMVPRRSDLTSRLEVDRDTGGSWLARHAAQQQAEQQASGQGGGQPDRGDHPGDRSRPWGAPADTAVSGPTPRNRATSSGVDVLA